VQPAERKLVKSLQSSTDDVLPCSTLDDEQFQLLDAYICISSHYRQLYSRNILCSCLKQPQLYNNSPFNYIETVDGSFVNRFPFLPGTCCCISVYNSFQLKKSLYKVSKYNCHFSYIPCSVMLISDLLKKIFSWLQKCSTCSLIWWM